MPKKTYYVNLNPISMDDLGVTKVEDSTLIQYEIEATEEQAAELRGLLDKVQAHDVELSNLLTFKHFNEQHRVVDGEEYQVGFTEIFNEIYNYGTDETKRKLETLDPASFTNQE